MSHQPTPAPYTGTPAATDPSSQGDVARLRPIIVWVLVALTAFTYLAGWINGLSVGRKALHDMALYSGGGMTSVAYAIPALAALVWAVAAAPKLDVRLPAFGLAGVMALDVVTALGFGIVALTHHDWRLGSAAYDLIELLSKAGVAAVAFLVATKHSSGVATGIPGGGRAEALGSGNQQPGIQQPGNQQQAVQQATQPRWQPDQASGGAWLRAGDAASGASASTWGTPGAGSQGSASWQPEVRAVEQQAWPQQQAGQQQAWPQESRWQPQTQQPQTQQPQTQQPQTQQPYQPQWQSQQDQQQVSASEEEGTVLRPAPQWPQEPRKEQ